jgi:hypothetical protein
MASRDRLKNSDESRRLREIVASLLRKGRLNEIYKRRRDSITLDAVDTPDLLKSFSKELPLNNELLKLLDKTFKLDEKRIEHKKRHEKDNPKYVKAEKDIFNPKRYPSFFKIKSRSKKEEPVLGIPLGGERTIQFDSDVENQYFVRVEYPGELKIALVNYKHNEDIEVEEGSSTSQGIEEIEDAFDVVKKSPNQGTIKVILTPTKNLQVGDMVKIEATLTNPGNDFTQVFWVKISSHEKQKGSSQKTAGDDDVDQLGLPPYYLVYKEKRNPEIEEGMTKTWEQCEEAGVEMSYQTVVYPYVGEDKLEGIYINMDSGVLKDCKSRIKSEESLELAEKRYITTIYFHTLFLYTITKKQKYIIKKMEGEEEIEKDLVDYIRDVFENYYSQFLLNFEISKLIDSLDE